MDPRGTRLGARGRMEPSSYVIRTVNAHQKREKKRDGEKEKERNRMQESDGDNLHRANCSTGTILNDRIVPT